MGWRDHWIKSYLYLYNVLLFGSWNPINEQKPKSGKGWPLLTLVQLVFPLLNTLAPRETMFPIVLQLSSGLELYYDWLAERRPTHSDWLEGRSSVCCDKLETISWFTLASLETTELCWSQSPTLTSAALRIGPCLPECGQQIITERRNDGSNLLNKLLCNRKGRTILRLGSRNAPEG